MHTLMNGITVFNVHALEILTYDGLRHTVGQCSEEELTELIRAEGRKGEIYRKLNELRDEYGDLIRARFPKIPRRVSGYANLDQLLPEHGFHVARALVGTEATCAMVLEATLDLIPNPRERVLAIMGFPDI
jgi:FAD/FMN-containing dehydrogenase